MFTVYLKSAGGTKKYFTEFETEAEAESFVESMAGSG